MNAKYLKQFEKYYNGEMEPAERASFEESLSRNPELDASFKEYLSIYDAIGDRDMLDLRIKLREIREELDRDRNRPDFFRHSYNWLWMAALITIIVSFTTIVSLLIAKVEWKNQVATELNTVDIHEYGALDRELMKFEQRNMDFNLESPKDSIFFSRKDPLLFQWTVNSTDPLILELIDWEGKIIFSSGKPALSPYLVKMQLPGGILVYRFRTDKEAYYIGFLFLK
jgi:hypothetical protein